MPKHFIEEPNKHKSKQLLWVIKDTSKLALTVYKILIFEIFNLKKVGPGHGVQRWQCRSQIANVKIYKHHFLHF